MSENSKNYSWPQELGALHSSPTLPKSWGKNMTYLIGIIDVNVYYVKSTFGRIPTGFSPIRNAVIVCVFLLGALSRDLGYADYVNSVPTVSTGCPHSSTGSRAGMYDRRDTTHIGKSLDVHGVPNFERLADAIYRAEGGAKTRHPYGIMKKYKTTTPRQACLNTLNSAFKRYKTDSKGLDFIEFLSKTYCPLSDPRDVSRLNRNWVSNVRSLYGLS